MARDSRAGIWMGAAFLLACALAAATLITLGTGSDGTRTALRLTARWSYCWFLPAYAGGALATLFGARFRPLAAHGRELGLAFASAHLVHVALVAWLYYLLYPRPALAVSAAAYFGVALVLTYVLALFSIPSLQAKLPPRAWWALRTLGMDYIALAFLRDFLKEPFGHGIRNLVLYLPFITLGIIAAALRAAGYVMRWRRMRAPSRLELSDGSSPTTRASDACATAPPQAGGPPATRLTKTCPVSRGSQI